MNKDDTQNADPKDMPSMNDILEKTSSDPRETIRIAFTWDPQTTKIVLGFIGQHQPNTKSA